MASTRLLLLFTLLPLTGFAQQPNRAKQLDSLFTQMNNANQFNGSVLIAEKGKIIFEKGYGYSDETTKKRNNTQTIFELGSTTKQFTAAAIVLLKRQDKLQYTDKMVKYLPELGFWDQVTIYDLLRHTSGLPEDYISDMTEGLWGKNQIATNADVIQYYVAHPDTLLFAPNSRHSYNNNNYAFLATIIERVSGMSYADFLAQNIFEPLHMQHTFVYNRRLQPRKIKNYAIGYTWDLHSMKKVVPELATRRDSMYYSLDGVVGSAKVNSNTEDLLKWLTALKNNTLFTQSELDEMTAVTQTSKGKSIPYGFGFDVVKRDSSLVFGHTGAWDGYVSYVSQNMTKDRTIVILENIRTGQFPYKNITQILDNKPVETVFPSKVILPVASMEKFVGEYPETEDSTETHLISYHDGHLFYDAKKSGEWDLRFYPVSDHEFAGIMSSSADAVMKFTTLENGDVKLEMLQHGEPVGSGIRKK